MFADHFPRPVFWPVFCWPSFILARHISMLIELKWYYEVFHYFQLSNPSKQKNYIYKYTIYHIQYTNFKYILYIYACTHISRRLVFCFMFPLISQVDVLKEFRPQVDLTTTLATNIPAPGTRNWEHAGSIYVYLSAIDIEHYSIHIYLYINRWDVQCTCHVSIYIQI